MLRSLFYLVKLVLFWLIVFTTGRLVFIVANFNRLTAGTGELITGIAYGFRLDLSTVGYFIIPSFILWVIQQSVKKNSINQISYVLNCILLLIAVGIMVGNALLYREWNTLLNVRAFMYLSSFHEVITFASLGQILLFTVGSLALGFTLLLLFHLIGLRNIPYSTKKWSVKLPVAFAPLLAVIFMIRGGWQLLPVNQSSAYYSANPLYNHFATNPLWYLASNIVETSQRTNTFTFLERKKAEKITDELIGRKNSNSSSIKLLNTQRPNIVILILESWTANVIASLGGEAGITPQFDSLRKQGLLFTNAYSSGYRTDQGLVSILSGFPAQPNTSIIFDPPKSEKLPNLNNSLLTHGYKICR